MIFPSKIYIQFTIFNNYFSTKFLFTDQRYHLHVLEKCLYVLQKVRSIIYFWQFIHPFSSFAWQWNKLCSHVVYHRVGKIVWRKQLLFCFILLPFVHLPAPKKNKTKYTNVDLKISLYVCVDIKTILLKFHIFNSKYSRVICPRIW